MKTAYIYARFSSDNQREESLDAQIRAIREYCTKNNIKIVMEFKDEAVSGRTDNRPAFQKMFGIIRDHPADLLIVHKLDRFARNRMDSAFYRAKLQEAGMKLVSVLEPIDDSPESIIMEGLLESLNEYYSANLSRETKKGQRENIINGKRCGGKCPRGYDCVDRKLYPNAEADRVRKVFAMYAAGSSIGMIEKETGYNRHGLREMIMNDDYIGRYTFGENTIENAHEAIIDTDTWDRCQQRIHNRQMNASNKAKHEYMLSGICQCAKCGKNMRATSVRGKYFYYRCPCNEISQDKLEKKVVERMSQFMTPTDKIKAKFYALVKSRVNSKQDTEKAEKTNSELRKRIDKLMHALQFADEDQVEEILKQARELKAQIQPVKHSVEISREACDAYIDMLGDFKNLSYQEQKGILRRILTKVIVDGDEVQFSLPEALGRVSI